MRLLSLVGAILLLVGCDYFSGGALKPAARAADSVSDPDHFAQVLDASYDNHEQAKRSTGVGETASQQPIHMQHSLRVVSSSATKVEWLWQVRTVAANSLTTLWLFRAERTKAGSWSVTPYRANDAGIVFPAATETFKIVAAQWSALAPCVQSGRWLAGTFESSANIAGCSALLPGLGAGGALLPLRFRLDVDMLDVTTIADSARGLDARQEARRVRWFSGWSAISGGGAQAQANNKDWHLQQNLRISSEGGTLPIRWRDGAISGYSIVLERASYPERKLRVLQLDVIEDATGKTMAYGWSDSASASIGLNLGWLQVGLEETARSNALR